MSIFDFFANLGAFFFGVMTGLMRLLLSIGWLLGGLAAHTALFDDTMVGAENSVTAHREGCRASTSVEHAKYTRKLQVVLLKMKNVCIYTQSAILLVPYPSLLGTCIASLKKH